METIEPRALLDAFSRSHPGCWQLTAELVQDKGQGLPDWPAWCWLPMAGSYAVISRALGVPKLGLDQVGDVARHAAFAAWRLTQGIYRFDPAVYDAVRNTPVAGDIPHQVLLHLPEWCIYVETPDLQHLGRPVRGAFVHLEYDANTRKPELRLLLNSSDLVAIPLHLGPWSLSESLDMMVDAAAKQASQLGSSASMPSHDQLRQPLRAVAEPIVSLVLYICSQANEISGEPRRPAPVRTKRGPQYFPADKPTTWDVGVRMGSALRRAYQNENTGQGHDHAGPRPHIRRAHWHGFRSGPRLRADGSEIPAADRAFDLRWLPPVAVNAILGETVPTVRPVTSPRP